jgi:small-conductance mechanosensitive channel
MRRLTLLVTVLFLGASAPDPANLDPNWWETFQEEPGPNLEETQTRLATVAANLSGESKEEADALVTQILANLDEWNRLRTTQPPTAAIPPSSKRSYTFDELIALSAQYSHVLQALESAQQEEENWLKRSKAVQQERGRAKVEYEKSQADTTSRLLLGLQIMLLRSEQAVYDGRYSIAVNATKAASTESQALNTLLIEALDRTDITPEEKEAIAAQTARERSTLLTYRATPHPLDDPQGSLLQLALIEAEAREALAHLITGAVNNGTVSKQLDNWDDQLKRMPPEVRQDPRFEQTEAILAPLRLAAAQHVVQQAPWWSKARAWMGRLWSSTTKVLHYTLFEIHGTPFTLFKLLKALLILLVGWLISKLARLGLRKWKGKKTTLQEEAHYSLRRVVHYAIILLAILFALGALGFNVNQLLVILGALSIGIGLGLQKVAANFVAGLTILLGHKIKVGDFIELESGHIGQVNAIHFQHSVIHTFDGRDVIIPNAQLIANYLVNWTMQNPYRRLSIPFTVAYGTDKELVRRVVLDAADRVPLTIKGNTDIADPNVRITEFGDNGIAFELIVWINFIEAGRYGHVTSLFLWEIESSLRDNGIEIPFPQRTLHFPEETPE